VETAVVLGQRGEQVVVSDVGDARAARVVGDVELDRVLLGRLVLELELVAPVQCVVEHRGGSAGTIASCPTSSGIGGYARSGSGTCGEPRSKRSAGGDPLPIGVTKLSQSERS
jgi:hypothetical protein